MDVLGSKYKQRREEILHSLNVSTELLTLLTREGLLDIADCVKYQGITNTKRRAAALMKTLTERRTDRAYGILLQCLRETGQHKAVDLLTDVGEEARAIQELQLELDSQIHAIDNFLETEEKRAGVNQEKFECGHNHPATSATPAVNDRQVWSDVQSSMRRAVDTLARCRTVISKLHADCLHVAKTNAELTTETRDCYLQLCGMVRPSSKSAAEIQTATTTTQELFRLLVSDVHRLITQRSKMSEREQEGRTSAMRILRKLRDWIIDRCTVLNTLHSSAPSAPLGNSRFLQRRGRFQHQPAIPSEVRHLTTYKGSPDRLSINEDANTSTDDINTKRDTGAFFLDTTPNFNTQPKMLHATVSHENDALLPLVPFATSTPQPNTNAYANFEACSPKLGMHSSPEFNVQPMSSVVEGVHQLEGQLREYIHLEILLTDRFRHELRRRQQQRKALGLSTGGIAEAQTIVSRLSSKDEIHHGDELLTLRSQLDRLSLEYAECCQYVEKAFDSMCQIDDVESFLKNIKEREQAYRKNKTNDTKNNVELQKSKTNKKESKALKKEQESYEALVELFRKGVKSKPKPAGQIIPAHKGKNNGFIKSIIQHNDSNKSPEDFLAKLKLLVANYEIVRLRMLTLEDRARREVARRERESKGLLQGRDEEIFRLQTLLREAEAEKEKYCRLYENTKFGVPKKRILYVNAASVKN